MVLLALCIGASLFGLVLVWSATASTGSMRYVIVQGIAIGIGLVMYIAFSIIDMDDLTNLWKLIFAFNILFIASTYFFGIEVSGNRSWIEIPGLGTSVQPAEVVKVSFIAILARQMYARRETISRPKTVGLLAVHLLLMVGLIVVAADDMGMAVVYVFVFIVMAFTAGVKLRWFVGLAAVAGGAFPIIWNYLKEYQRMRILVVLDPSLDPLGKGWQAARSKLALGSGQLFGQGLFNGTQTQKGILPAKHTDFIFSVAGEELGMIGCAAILLMLVAIIVRCLFVARNAKNGTGALICVGMASMLLFQTLINIGMCVGLTPVIGITLPFFSSGGTSIITMFAAMGMVSSVRKHPMPEWLRRNR